MLFADDTALRAGIVRVLNSNGNAAFHGRLHRNGMEDLRPEVGQLSRFLVRYGLDGDGVVHETRVGGKDTVNVFPDLHLIQTTRGTNSGGTKIRATTAEGSNAPLGILTDEASNNGNHIGINFRGEGIFHCLLISRKELGIAKIRIRHNSHVPGIDGLGRDANLVKTGSNDTDRAALTIGHQLVEGLWRQLLQKAHATEHILAFVQQCHHFIAHVLGQVKLLNGSRVKSSDGVDVDPPLEGKITRGKERVGRFAHGTANYSPWTISDCDLILNELGYVINAIGVSDGRPSKLHRHVNFLATLSTCFGNALGAHLLLVLVEVVSSLFVLPTTDHT
mmetsp:Transcript_30615/g.89453  ORF Transcript_30615/g.89453 Transcript_30615/m.89453 type:complete len:334 (-) Transcript_30615:257-1258(-)